MLAGGSRAGWSASQYSAVEVRVGAAAEPGAADLRESLDEPVRTARGSSVMVPAQPRQLSWSRCEATLKVGRDQVVLGGEVPVEGHPGHLGLGDHPVDPDRADSLGVEEPVGGREDAGCAPPRVVAAADRDRRACSWPHDTP